MKAAAQQMSIGIRLGMTPPTPSAALWSDQPTQPVVANPYTGLIQVSNFEKEVAANRLEKLLSRGVLNWRGLSPHLICDGCDNGTFIPKIHRSISPYCNHSGISASVLNGGVKKIQTAAQVAMTCITPHLVQGFIQDSFLVGAPSPPRSLEDVVQVRLPFRLLTIGSHSMNRRYLKRSLQDMAQHDVILVSCFHKTVSNTLNRVPNKYLETTTSVDIAEYTRKFSPKMRQEAIDHLQIFDFGKGAIEKLTFEMNLTAYSQAGLKRLADECGGKVLWSQPVSTQGDYGSPYEALCAIIVRKHLA